MIRIACHLLRRTAANGNAENLVGAIRSLCDVGNPFPVR